MGRWIAMVLLAMASVTSAATPAAAAEPDANLWFVETAYTLTPTENGYLIEAVEQVEVSYDQNDGGGETAEQRSFHLNLAAGSVVESVESEAGDSVPYTVDDQGDRVALTAHPPPDTYLDDYVIRYSLPAMVTGSPEQQRWLLTLDVAEWPDAAPYLTARFIIPPSLAFVGPAECQQTGNYCYLDDYEELERLLISDLNSSHEPITVSIGFADRSVAESTPAVNSSPFRGWPTVPSLVVIALAAAFIVLSAALRVRTRRGPRGRATVIAEYAPPSGLNVMVAAHLLGRSRTAVPAQLLALALSKNVKIIERSMRRRRSGYAVQFVSAEGVDAIGGLMLQALFSDNPLPGAIRELRAEDRRLARAVTGVSAMALREASARGWRAPSGASQWLLTTASLMLAVFTGLMCLAGALTKAFSPWEVLAFFAAPAAVVVCFTGISFLGPLTRDGAVVRDHLVGLRLYLSLAERDRLRLLQASDTAERVDAAGAARAIKVYEKLLPYAVVWGVDETWIRELVGDAIDLDAAPDWLSNPNALAFVGSFQLLIRSWRLRASGFEKTHSHWL